MAAVNGATPASILIALVAAQHVGFLILEMFLWERPLGLRVFGHSPQQARQTRILAANLGLYNGFLAAGLAWSLWPGSPGRPVAVFFLVCIVVAGIFGAATARRLILPLQALPAAIALAAVVWSA